MRLPGPVRLFDRPALLALGLALIAPGRRFPVCDSARRATGSTGRRKTTSPIPADAASIARGRHLVEAVAVCTICHGENLGGKLAFEDNFLGRGYTANLTSGRGGVGRTYSTADWVRSIRYGVRPDGRGIIFMPSDYFNRISDADLGAIIAYLQSLPPVDNERTAVEINFAARLLIDLGMFGDVVRAARIDFRAPRPPPPADPGAYLVTLGGCTFCHGPHLTGGQGPEPGAPGGPDLTAGGPLSRWSLADFVRDDAQRRQSGGPSDRAEIHALARLPKHDRRRAPVDLAVLAGLAERVPASRGSRAQAVGIAASLSTSGLQSGNDTQPTQMRRPKAPLTMQREDDRRSDRETGLSARANRRQRRARQTRRAATPRSMAPGPPSAGREEIESFGFG